MSIYCTGYTLRLPVDVPCTPEEKEAIVYAHGEALGGPGTPVRERWIEVYFQHVPNHINEENGYVWDYLPAFQHRDGCVRRVYTLTHQDSGTYPYFDCDCGNRCVFVLDEDHDEKIGQRYTDPLMVLTGAEYQAASFDDLLARINVALDARFGVHNSGGTKVMS